MAEKCFPTVPKMQGFSSDGDTFRNYLNGTATDGPNLNREGVDVGNLEKLKKQALEQAAGAARLQTYLTVAQMRADTSQPVPTTGQVTNDPNADSNGYYVWDGADWDWSGLQPVSTNEFEKVDQAASAALVQASKPNPTTGDFYPKSTPQRQPIIVDSVGKNILSVDENGLIVTGWMLDFHSWEEQPAVSYVDEMGRVLLSWDKDGNLLNVSAPIDPEALQKNIEGLAPGSAWNNHGVMSVLASSDSYFRAEAGATLLQHQQIYDLFDGLVAEYPDYITREKLGEDGVGNSIFAYHFTPPDYHLRWYDTNHTALVQKPKIVLLGSTHGNEKNAVATNFSLMREIAVNWRNDRVLSKLRWGAKFVVVPVVTPSGFDTASHLNHNGVNINRNYPTEWELAAESGRGPSPASELETQIILQLAQDHSDACGFVDAHNGGGIASQGFAYWLATERGETLGIALECLNHMTEYVKSEYAHIPSDNSPIVQLTNSYSGTCSKHMQAAFNLNTFTVETGGGFGTDPYQRERHALEGVKVLIWKLVEQENQRRQREYSFGDNE